MTDMEHLFSSYSKSKAIINSVKITDRSHLPVDGQGLIPTSTVSFYSTLPVPGLSVKLLSASHLTKTLNFSATFFPTYCAF